VKIAIYARVSTHNGQDPEMQLRELREYCQRREWDITREYVDVGISGGKEKRPELDKLLHDAHRRYFDAVVVWRFDRFARSVSHLLKALENFRSLGIEFVSLSEQVDTSTPILALNTGMRRGELLSLEWQQVDLIHGRIRILNAKTNSSERSIPLNAISRSTLLELARDKKSNLVFPSNRKVGKRILDLKKGFRKAVQSAGIASLRFHDLRHTFATRLVQAGVDIITVQHLLGHAKISMTVRYAHSPDESKIAAVKRLDELFSSQPAPNRPLASNMRGEAATYKPQQVNTLGP